MKKYLTLIIILISLTSCSQIREENNEGLTLTLKYDSAFSDRELLKTIIEDRLTDYGIEPHNVKYIENSHIQIDFTKTSDSLEVKNLLCTTGQFQIKETFDNTEIFKFLVNLNKSLKNKGISSNDTTEYNKEYPLFSLLKPIIHNEGYLLNGPVIGYSYEKDTAIINKYLIDGSDIFPKGLEYIWSKEQVDGFFQLIALKNTNYRTAPITEEMIKYAKPEKDDFNLNTVAIQFKEKYKKTWADFTRLNTGRSLAIIIDGIVFSYPHVIAEIPNGALSIAGDLSFKEAKLISSFLSNGKMPCKIEFVSMESKIE